jgi:hypothetical protein
LTLKPSSCWPVIQAKQTTGLGGDYEMGGGKNWQANDALVH